MKEILKKIAKVVEENNSFLVVSHTNPEGDAIGSTLAISTYLLERNKRVIIFNEDKIAKMFHFLPNVEKFVNKIDDTLTTDVLISVDCGDIKMTGPQIIKFVEEKRCNLILNLDHHLTNTYFGDINLVYPEAPSAGVILYYLFKEIPIQISYNLAICIYTTILVDTGSFRYTGATKEAFTIAGELVEVGVDPWKVAREIYENQPIERIKLLALVLNTLQLSKSKKVASIRITEDMYKKTGATYEMTDGFINYPRSIEGVEVAFILREHEKGTKVSFRSLGNIDVSKIASMFGGGGHHNASGCIIEMGIPEVEKMLFETIDRLIEELKS